MADPTPLRQTSLDTRPPEPRILELQKALDAEVELLVQRIYEDVLRVQGRLESAKDYPIKPGIKEEFRSLGEALGMSTKRLQAIRSR